MHHHYGKPRPKAPLIAIAGKALSSSSSSPVNALNSTVDVSDYCLPFCLFITESSRPLFSVLPNGVHEFHLSTTSQFKYLMPVFVVVASGDKGSYRISLSSFIIKAMKYALLSTTPFLSPNAPRRTRYPFTAAAETHCNNSIIDSRSPNPS